MDFDQLFTQLNIPAPKEREWIGVDLDGTLATYQHGQYPNVGELITPMFHFCRYLQGKGYTLQVVTARVNPYVEGRVKANDQIASINLWLQGYFEFPPAITYYKDRYMLALFDDRAYNVAFNQGLVALGYSPTMDITPPKAPALSVPDLLHVMALTYEERSKVYGDNYKLFGAVLLGLFPDGITLKTSEDFIKFGVLQNCITKMGRYAGHFARTKKGHIDSAHDLSVYAAMLEEVSHE